MAATRWPAPRASSTSVGCVWAYSAGSTHTVTLTTRVHPVTTSEWFVFSFWSHHSLSLSPSVNTSAQLNVCFPSCFRLFHGVDLDEEDAFWSDEEDWHRRSASLLNTPFECTLSHMTRYVCIRTAAPQQLCTILLVFHIIWCCGVKRSVSHIKASGSARAGAVYPLSRREIDRNSCVHFDKNRNHCINIVSILGVSIYKQPSLLSVGEFICPLKHLPSHENCPSLWPALFFSSDAFQGENLDLTQEIIFSPHDKSQAGWNAENGDVRMAVGSGDRKSVV